LFSTLNAKIEILPVMTPDDVRTGLEQAAAAS
jgi:hypothetical protein